MLAAFTLLTPVEPAPRIVGVRPMTLEPASVDAADVLAVHRQPRMCSGCDYERQVAGVWTDDAFYQTDTLCKNCRATQPLQSTQKVSRATRRNH